MSLNLEDLHPKNYAQQNVLGGKLTQNSAVALSTLAAMEWIRVTELQGFLECPKRWKSAKLGETIRKESKYAKIGTAVHAITESYLRREFDLFEKSSEPFWLEAVRAGVNDKERRALVAYLQTLSERRDKIVALEMEFTIPVVAGAWPLRGHIDLIAAEDDGSITIVDHKTNRNYEGAEVWAKKIQMIAYAYAVRKMLPQVERIQFEIGYVNLGSRVTWLTDPNLDQWFETRFAEAWEEFRTYSRHSEWPERLNSACGYCPLAGSCPTFKASMGRLLPNLEKFANASGPASGNSPVEEVLWLETALKAGRLRLESLQGSLIESAQSSGGSFTEAGHAITLAYSSRRQVDQRIAWSTLMELLHEYPELDQHWEELMSDTLTFKVGGIDKLVQRAEQFRPIIERAIRKVTSEEPTLKIDPLVDN